VSKKKNNSREACANAPIAVVVTPLKAADAGEALRVVAGKLSGAGILTHSGAAILDREARKVSKLKRSLEWSVTIDPSDPVRFAQASDKNGNAIQPWLSVNMSVNQALKGRPPFSALDVALQLDDSENKPVARWHLDLANKKRPGAFQPGPLFHLQYGGHHRDYRELDHPLNVPRWCHPPMEITLICEMVAANFFQNRWLELREDTSWCQAIWQYEKLCYADYLNKMATCLDQSASTMLTQMWADDWVKNLGR
jgi:hypothetical protein